MKASWLQLYFVLASLLGLILMSVGSIVLLNSILNQSVFKTQSQDYQGMPIQPYIAPEAIENNTELTESEKQSLTQWQNDYKNWETKQSKYDYEAEQRKRALSMGIAMVVTGVPLFALHAPTLFRKMREV